MLLRWTHKKSKFIEIGRGFLWFKFISSTIIVIFMIENHRMDFAEKKNGLSKRKRQKNVGIGAQSSNYHWKLLKEYGQANTLHKIPFENMQIPVIFFETFHTIPCPHVRTHSRISMCHRLWAITIEEQNHRVDFSQRAEREGKTRPFLRNCRLL